MKKTPVILAAGAALVVAAGTYGWLYRPVPESHAPPAAPRSSSNLSRIQNPERALADRLKAVREISTDLSNEELQQLIAFLSKPLSDRNRENELMAINQVMDQLRVSGMACGEYATALCGLIRNPEIDPIVRDYAIQHAVAWIKEAHDGRAPATVTEEDRKHMLDCIVSFLQQPASLFETGYGTALNVIRSIEPEYPEEVADIFTLCAPRLMEIATGRESSPLSNRIAAIQSLPALPDREQTRTLVRGMVSDSPSSSPVRLVAIGTLGALGDKSDLATLRQIQHADHRVSYAARAAADRLESSPVYSN